MPSPVTDRISSRSAEAVAVFHHVAAQRQIIGITVDQSIDQFIALYGLTPDDFDRLRTAYFRIASEVKPVFDASSNRCVDCPKHR